MLSTMRNFVNRHRRKFVVGGLVVAGGALALRYAQRKMIEYQESMTREFLEKTKRTQHFESTERSCNQAIMGLAPNLIEQILRRLDTDDIVRELRHNPDNKVELWNLLKIKAISRLCALVYASSMLVITLRVQFNILGGYLYKDAVANEENVTNEIQSNYVALIQHFLCNGCDTLCQLIQSKCEQILNGYDLTRKLTLSETEQILWSIQMAINSDARDPSSNLASYVYPSDAPASTSNPLFIKMYTETLDMLESNDVSSLNATNISRGFSIVVDNIADFYFKPINGTTTPAIKENGIPANHQSSTEPENEPNANTIVNDQKTTLPNINLVSIPLAKLIPILDGVAKQEFNGAIKPPTLSTSLVTLFLISDKVKILGANVYEVFSQ